MDYSDELIARLKARVADPLLASDSAAQVRPVFPVPPPASDADAGAAEAALGFPLPPFLRRLYTEVGNGNWGPSSGLQGLPSGGTEPDGNDLVGLYHEFTAPERAMEEPAVEWPRGLVVLIHSHHLEVCDFLRPPHPVFHLDPETWDLERPVVESLVLIAASIEERLEAWLDGSPDDEGELLARINARAADTNPGLAPPASLTDVCEAELNLALPIPILLWRLYTQVGNGGWGPDAGVLGVPTAEAPPGPNDLVGRYRALREAPVEWPRGMVPLIATEGGLLEVCDFLRRPYPVFRVEADSLVPVAPSLSGRLGAWLAGPVEDRSAGTVGEPQP